MKLTSPLSICTFCCVSYFFNFRKILASKSNKEYCFTQNEEVKCESSEFIKLTRLNGHEIGHVEEINNNDALKLQLRTVSVKPLILEIPSFLTNDECDHLKDLAISEGLKSSETHNWSQEKRFVLYDADNDKRLSVDEMKTTLMNGFDVHLDKEDILQMYKEIKIDKDNNEYITRSEMSSYSPNHFELYLKKFLRSHPEKHSRYSRQVWLYPDQSKDQVFDKIIRRASSVVGLPVELLKLSDFQVVNYDIKGHYHAHYDSSDLNKSKVCCDKVRKNNCRICRYMTIFFYLNDVEEGGETAFPVANNETVHQTEIYKQSLYNLNENCGSPGLKVKAEKGKAIIWYNHFVDPETGWMGEQDEHTYHGGCPVKRGEKWIANFWIKVTDDKETDLANMHKFHKLSAKKFKQKKKDEL